MWSGGIALHILSLCTEWRLEVSSTILFFDPPVKNSPEYVEEDAGWARQSLWTRCRSQTCLPLPGVYTRFEGVLLHIVVINAAVTASSFTSDAKRNFKKAVI
jgi:hypothetical protein